MTAKTVDVNRVHGMTFKFRDAVTEICERSPELLAKQRALRVESWTIESGCTASAPVHK